MNRFRAVRVSLTLGFLSLASYAGAQNSPTPVAPARLTAPPIAIAPVPTAPVATAPVAIAPVAAAAVPINPVSAAPVTTLQLKTAPVETVPVKSTPVKTAPAQSTPAQSAPVKTAPVYSAPVASTPATPPNMLVQHTAPATPAVSTVSVQSPSPDLGLAPCTTCAPSTSCTTFTPCTDAACAPCTNSACCTCGDAQTCCCESCSLAPGWFAGIGGSYNSVRANVLVSGSGISNIYSGSQLVAIGTAGGPAAPIRETDTTFAPVVQAGYSQHFADSPFLWGGKFSYKYLGLTLSQNNIDAPQVGVYEQFDPPSTNSLTGNATVNSVQTTVNNEFALLPFLGHQYSHGRIYVGGGPVLFDTNAALFGLRDFADINGTHTNVGGQPLHLNSNKQLWGGAFQMGLVHYLSRSCFLDVSYDFMVTGINRLRWDVHVTNETNGLTYQTDITYREELRLWAQSFNVTLNVGF